MGTDIQTFKRTLTSMVDARDLPLPSTVDPGSFRNAAIVAVQDNPSILQCDQASVFRAIRQLANVGLVPDNREAAIVPFKGKAVAQPMVYGLIKTARNSGQVVTMWAETVLEGETLHVGIEGGERVWEHVNEDGSKIDAMRRKGEIVGAYAVAKLKDGTIEFEPMGLEEIEKRRKASPNQKSANPTGIWADWYSEMAKKTVIRALCKRLPMSAEDYSRIQEDPTFREVKEIKDVTPMSTADRLRQVKQRDEALSELARTDAALGELADAGQEFDAAPEYDDALVFPGDAEFTEGAKAYSEGLNMDACPYNENPKFSNWIGGWQQAEQAAA